MRVLVADKFEESGVEGIEALGCEVTVDPALKEESLIEAIRSQQPDVLIVRSTKVPAAAFQYTSLRLAIRAGAGYNNLDTQAAAAVGVPVCNCPGKNAAAVAELAFGLILALDRRIPDNVATFRKGVWDKAGFGKAKGIAGATLGLVGFGQIGQEMVPRARAFGMHVLVHSQWLDAVTAASHGVALATSLTDLASRSDIVSVHCSLRPETKCMLGSEFFSAMKPGAFFVNTSRAEVVDEAALLEAVRSGAIRAGLDVFEGEPAVSQGEQDSPWKAVDGAYVTHHIGASTNQAQEAVAAETVRIVREFMATGTAPNVVNGV
ncbi:MAG: NAD(P)-dependent oxidoreductase [Fimbriimonadaceae bacterium]